MESAVNAEHIAVWNDIVGPKYIRFRHVLGSGLGEHARVALAQHGPRPGDAVLDVGCGMGESTLDLARMVGPRGRVLGLDGAEAFLAIARREADAAGLANVQYEQGDAQSRRFEPVFDLCFSRFGTMFFSSPVAAMKNVRKALKPGGRLAMVVWRTLADNEWMGLAKKIALEHLPPPGEQAPNCGPGPFSMADRETVAEILQAAGYADVDHERIDASVMVGRDVDDAIDFQLAVGPAGEIVREAGEQGEAKRSAIAGDLKKLIARFTTPAGIVMGSSSWCVTARNPG